MKECSLRHVLIVVYVFTVVSPNSDFNNSEAATIKSKDISGFSWLAKGLMLGVAYSANIGGIATLTGTGPNLVFKGDIEK